MTTDIHDTSLYAAGLEAQVANKTANSCFEKMAMVGMTHTHQTTFLYECKRVEDVLKEELQLTSMPDAWRSAKSVVNKARYFNIPLCDSNGNIRGKTELQKAIKEVSTEPPSAYTSAIKHADALQTLFKNLGGTEIPVIKTYLRDYIEYDYHT
jgi:hypothetical protein